jgi:primosomal protein N''
MTSMMGGFKVQQHWDQTHILSLQVELEKTNKKTKNMAKYVAKCRTAITMVETKLETLSTTEEGSKQFDKIAAMFAAVSEPLRRFSDRGKAMLTQKRKG